MFDELTYSEARELSAMLHSALQAAITEVDDLGRIGRKTRIYLYDRDDYDAYKAMTDEFYRIAAEAFIRWNRARAELTA